MNFAIAGTLPTATLLSSEGGTAGTAPGAAEHRKLTTAAQQFEGMLLQEMLKPMREHLFCGNAQDEAEGNGGKEASGYGDTLLSFGTETMATAIAKGGGLGIAKRVIAQVEGEKASRTSHVRIER
jgi:peptidoglycan hydrolase FlgJ